MNIISILLIILIFIVFMVINFFITDPKMKLAYWFVVGLLFLTVMNIYMSIIYYIKLREDPGEPGPRGPKGQRGPQGDIGKCTFSETCGIQNCSEKIYGIGSKYYPNINIECLKDTTKCSNEEKDKAIPVSNVLKTLISECESTQRSEDDFIRKITPLIANMEKN
jgi:hypothetical protein